MQAISVEEDSDSVRFILYVDERRIGSALVELHQTEWELVDIGVNKPYRGQQYGRQLMSKVFSWADEHGHDLYVHDPDTENRGFYPKVGFVWHDDEEDDYFVRKAQP